MYIVTPRPVSPRRVHKEGDRCVSECKHGGFRTRKSVGEWGYRRKVAGAWRVEVGLLSSREERRALERRLDEFMKCGQSILVRSCGCCGSDREGSGTYEGTRTCKCRVCAACAWVRAKKVGEMLESAFDSLGGSDGYHWQMVTVTIRYNPTDEDDLSAVALRSRALLAGRVGKRAWTELLKVPGAGMLRTIECSKRGHVHLNLIYFGPTVYKEDFERTVKVVDCRVGFCDIKKLDSDPAPRGKRVKCDDPRGSKKAVKTAAKYVSKGLESGRGGNDEDWLAGDRAARVVDPILAARWEIAAYKLKLMQRYGALRGVALDEHGREGESGHEDDSEVVCDCCGSVGAWKTVYRKAENWIQEMHDKGCAALVGSEWKPRPRDGPEWAR